MLINFIISAYLFSIIAIQYIIRRLYAADANSQLGTRNYIAPRIKLLTKSFNINIQDGCKTYLVTKALELITSGRMIKGKNRRQFIARKFHRRF